MLPLSPAADYRLPSEALSTTKHNVHIQRTLCINQQHLLFMAYCPQTTKEDILLLDSDILFDPKVITELLQSEKADTLAVNKHKLGEEEIKVIADAEGKIIEISKTCSISQAMGESIGIEKMSAAYTDALFQELDVMIRQEKLDNIFYEGAFERLIPQGYSFIRRTPRSFSQLSWTP